MQAVIFDTLGISELQSLKASLVHICCASGLNARLAAGRANNATAKAEATTANLVILKVMVKIPGEQWVDWTVGLFQRGFVTTGKQFPCVKK
jgi:hypothetical protein